MVAVSYKPFSGRFRILTLYAQLASDVPLGRIGQPEEIAKAAVFLASEYANVIAGIELFVDGGVVQV